MMETEFDRIKNAAEFFYNSQGYININSLSNMIGVPILVLENVLEQIGFKKCDRDNKEEWMKNEEEDK